jgi:hypothetical protein
MISIPIRNMKPDAQERRYFPYFTGKKNYKEGNRNLMMTFELDKEKKQIGMRKHGDDCS